MTPKKNESNCEKKSKQLILNSLEAVLQCLRHLNVFYIEIFFFVPNLFTEKAVQSFVVQSDLPVFPSCGPYRTIRNHPRVNDLFRLRLSPTANMAYFQLRTFEWIVL